MSSNLTPSAKYPFRLVLARDTIPKRHRSKAVKPAIKRQVENQSVRGFCSKATDVLKPSPLATTYNSDVTKDRFGVMFKLNLQKNVHLKRDLGGISSVALAAIALVLCLEWSLLIHLG